MAHPADDKNSPNCCFFQTKQNKEMKIWITSCTESVDLLSLELPTVSPLAIIGRTFLIKRKVDDTVHCAEVICCVESVDQETDQYLVQLGDGKRQEVLTYDT